MNYIRIGKGTNIQDNSVVHVTHDTHPTIIGDYVTVGHRVILLGCKIGNYILVGMGAVVMDGVVEMAGYYGDYGKAVLIKHPSGYMTLYGHLSEISV